MRRERERNDGLYYPDGSFSTRQEVVDKLAKQNEQVIFHTPRQTSEKDFGWWQDTMKARQNQRKEVLGRRNHVKIEIPTEDPTLLVFIGDVHAGSEDVDYERFGREIAYVRDRPNTYALALGDLTDAFFFNPAQHEAVANIVEQQYYMKSALSELKGKLLVAWGGDHDQWSEKMGATMYDRFESTTGAHFMDGVGYVSLTVGEQDYKIAAAHKHKGFSIYNSAHAAQRLKRDSAEGADILVTAHNHQKAINEQTVKPFGGDAYTAYYFALGTYKSTDRYARKLGYPPLTEAEMGASGVILSPDERKIETIWELPR